MDEHQDPANANEGQPETTSTAHHPQSDPHEKTAGIKVREATMSDVLEALPDIRPEDLAEWYAGTGLPFEAAAELALKGYAKVALLDGRPACLWGCSDGVAPRTGMVWIFATTFAVEHFSRIHEHLKAELQALLDRWPTLHALADSENVVHHKWLERLGFRPYREEFLAPLDLPFKLFEKGAA